MSRTAFTAGELTNLRTRPHTFPLFLAVHRPRTIYTARVASVPVWPNDGTGVGEIAFSSGSGTVGDIVAGMTLFIGSSAGARDRGILRIRAAISATPLKVSATAQGQIDIQANDYLTVVEDYRVFAKRHRYAPQVSGVTGAGAWVMDFDVTYAAASVNNATFGPQAVLGCAAIKYAAGSQNFVYDGTRSQAFTPSTSISSYLWTFPDGSTSTSSAPTFATSTAYPDGRWTSLRVTDSGGKTHTGRRLLWKFDSSNLPYTAAVIETMTGEWGGGWSAQVRVRGAATIAEFPVGGHVALFTQSIYGSTTVDIGGNFPDRANIVLEGWIKEGTIQQEPESGDVLFTIETTHSEMARQFAFPIDLTTTTGTPANWLTMKNITLDRAAFFICLWQSTLLDVVDVTFVGSTAAATNTKKYQSLPPMQNLWSLLEQNYAWLPGGTVSCDSQSALYFEQNSIVAGDTSSKTSMLTLGDADIRGLVEIAERDYLPNAQITLYGVDSSTGADIPVGARAGDDPVGYAETIEEVPDGLMMTAAQSRTWSGNMKAMLNNPYPSATIPMSGAWRIDPAPQSFITWTPDSADLKRVPTGWTSKRLIIRKTTYEFPEGESTMLATFECEPETDGPDGVSVSFTPNSTLVTNRKRNGRRRAAPAPAPAGQTSGNIPSEPGDGKLLYVASPSIIARTRDCTVSSPAWEGVYDKKYSISYAWNDVTDPLNVGYVLDIGGTTTAPLGGLYRTTSLNSTHPTWTLMYNWADVPSYYTGAGQNWTSWDFIRSAQSGVIYTVARRSRNVANHQSPVLGVSYDQGVAWTWLTLSTVELDVDWTKCFYASDKDNQRIYYGASKGSNLTNRLFATATGLSNMVFVAAIASIGSLNGLEGIHVPYADNATDQVIYLWTDDIVYRSTAGLAGALTDVTPVTAAKLTKNQVLWSNPTNRLDMWIMDLNGELFHTVDGATGWSNLSNTGLGANTMGAFYYHYPSEYLYSIRVAATASGSIKVSLDGGNTWVDRVGDYATSIGSYAGGVSCWSV